MHTAGSEHLYHAMRSSRINEQTVIVTASALLSDRVVMQARLHGGDGGGHGLLDG